MAANQDVHITLQFPLAGLDRSGSYRSSPPYGTVSAMNVRPPDVYEARRRGGSRPGVVAVSADKTIGVPGTGSVVELNSVTYADEDTITGDIEHVTELVALTSSTHRYLTSAEWGQKLFIAIPDGPKVYDPLDGTGTVETYEAEIDPEVSPEATKGEVPVDCPLIARYRDRIFMAGDPGYMWYASRTANPYDWDYGQTDPGRAVSGLNSEAGTVGDPITAMFAHGDSYLAFGCVNAIWVMRGDPAYGGRIDNVSRTVGILGPHAWTHGPGGMLYFLSHNGLMSLPPGLGGVPQPVSQFRLPQEMKGVDPNDYRIALAYDALAHGLHLYCTHDTEASKDIRYWYDFGHESFWPFDTIERVISRGYQDTADRGRQAVLGCTTSTGLGPIISFESGVLEGESDNPRMSSHVVYGPVMLGGSEYVDGMVVELIGTLAQDSGNVRWKLYVGETPERAASLASANSTPFASGTWSAGTTGLNYTERPRARGGAFALRLESMTNSSWAMESVHAKVRNLGAKRKL